MNNIVSEIKKSALVTGASRGIGRACAVRLAREGFSLIAICADKDIAGLRETEALIRDASPDVSVLSLVGDISDEDFVKNLRDRLSEASGSFGNEERSLDLLVNNAGISVTGLIQELSYDDWKHIIDVDLSSVFLTVKAFVPDMIRAGSGRIVNVSSMWGRVGASCEAAYSAAKGGVIAFSKALAKELAPSGIAVNCIAPGVIDTEMNSRLNESEKTELIEEIPVGRFGTPEEVADSIAFLSAAPLYMTGQVIGIDGGFI